MKTIKLISQRPPASVEALPQDPREFTWEELTAAYGKARPMLKHPDTVKQLMLLDLLRDMRHIRVYRWNHTEYGRIVTPLFRRWTRGTVDAVIAEMIAMTGATAVNTGRARSNYEFVSVADRQGHKFYLELDPYLSGPGPTDDKLPGAVQAYLFSKSRPTGRPALVTPFASSAAS